MADFLLGADYGTGGAKIALIDSSGEQLGYAYEEYPIHTEHSGWSEHDAPRYWEAFCRMVRKALTDTGVDPAEIRGVATSSALRARRPRDHLHPRGRRRDPLEARSCDLETPQSVAEAVLLDEVTVTPEQMHSEVVCTAKRDIEPGTMLDGIGGPDWYGVLMAYPEARAVKAVPIGVGARAVVKRHITTGATITEDDVTIDDSTFVARLRRLQDTLYG